jgi:hypothetical protein
VLRVLERFAPATGKDLTLSLDYRVQRAAFDAMGDRRGAVVAIDPRTGGLLALVSTPGFDTNLFVNGISSSEYAALRVAGCSLVQPGHPGFLPARLHDQALYGNGWIAVRAGNAGKLPWPDRLKQFAWRLHRYRTGYCA